MKEKMLNYPPCDVFDGICFQGGTESHLETKEKLKSEIKSPHTKKKLRKRKKLFFCCLMLSYKEKFFSCNDIVFTKP